MICFWWSNFCIPIWVSPRVLSRCAKKRAELSLAGHVLQCCTHLNTIAVEVFLKGRPAMNFVQCSADIPHLANALTCIAGGQSKQPSLHTPLETTAMDLLFDAPY